MSLWSESKISSLHLWFHLEKQGSKAGYAVGRGNRILKFTVRSNQVSLPANWQWAKCENLRL